MTSATDVATRARSTQRSAWEGPGSWPFTIRRLYSRAAHEISNNPPKVST
jgi:hypothetical protein